MYTQMRTTNDGTSFWLHEVPPAYHALLEKWDFVAGEAGFVKHFPADTPHLEAIYANFSGCIESAIRQALGQEAAPWEESLRRALERLAGAEIDWFLGGSAALAVRGVKVQPHDVDLVTDAAGALRIGEVLGDCLFEPMTRYTDWICDWKGHAWLGARVEWVGGVHAEIDAEEISDFGPIAASRLESIHWCGYPLRVAPLEMQLAVSLRRGLAERAAAIQAVLERQR